MRLHPPSAIRAMTLLIVLTAGVLAAGGSAGASPSPLSGRHLYGIGQIGSSREVLPFDVAVDGRLVQRENQAFPLPPQTQGSLVVGRNAHTVYAGIAESFDMNTFQLIPGAIDVLSIASDGSLSLLQTVSAVSPNTLAITPDGTRLFATTSTDDVVSFPIATDGTLGAASAPTTVPDGGALSITFSPVGPTLYVGTYNAPIFQFSVGVDGSLTPLSPASIAHPCQATFTGLAPNGTVLDVFCDSSQNGYTYAIGADGALSASPTSVTARQGEYAAASDVRGRAVYTAVSPTGIEQWQRGSNGSLAAFPAGPVASNQTQSMAADPSGDTLVADSPNTLSRYEIAADGSLSASPIDLTTTADYVLSMVYGPDQPPVAAVTATSSELTTSFDAGASHAVDGAIASYDWSFGDGSTLVNGGPTPTHSYAHAGDYTARVTLSDSLGCSLASTFSGQQSICAGSPTARASTTVHVAPALVALVPSDATPAAVDPPAAPATPPPAPDRFTLSRTLQGAKVLLSWRVSLGTHPTRYLIVWSVEHSARGAADPRIKHRRWTTKTTLRLPRTTAHTIHVAVYAYGADGALLRGAKKTLRLRR
jgi:6-phosphogluconolactonase (cycloisomerase 2 family)